MGYGAILGKSFDGFTKEQTMTQSTAALYNLPTTAVPNDVFNILSASALYKTVAATQQLGSLTEGSIIYLNENGSPVPFYVAKQNYESSYNTNRTLVVRKDVVTQGAWNSSSVNTYDGSTIDEWFNSTYMATLDSDVQTAIGTTNIPATSPYNSGVIRLNKAVFALSGTEIGFTAMALNIEGSKLSISNSLAMETEIYYWTRSPINSDSATVYVGSRFPNSASAYYSSNASIYYRPAFTLPSTFTAYIEEPTTGLYDVLDNPIMPLSGMPRIATGSYKGNGNASTTEDIRTLNCGFPPQLVIVFRDGGNATFSGLFVRPCTYGLARFDGNDTVKVTWSDTGVSWRSADGYADRCLNTSGITYLWWAIG